MKLTNKTILKIEEINGIDSIDDMLNGDTWQSAGMKTVEDVRNLLANQGLNYVEIC